MRLWHESLINVLPNAMLVSQWRECLAIKRQWEKGTLKHRLVSYVMKYPKRMFYWYTKSVTNEMKKRNINFREDYLKEIEEFCKFEGRIILKYPEHNDEYIRECLYNLEEKAYRGIVSKDEWTKIYNKYKEDYDLWEGDVRC